MNDALIIVITLGSMLIPVLLAVILVSVRKQQITRLHNSNRNDYSSSDFNSTDATVQQSAPQEFSYRFEGQSSIRDIHKKQKAKQNVTFTEETDIDSEEPSAAQTIAEMLDNDNIQSVIVASEVLERKY